MDEARLMMLLAPLPGRVLSVEESCIPWQKPTYRAILQALQTLLDSADPGDIVYIHYSGHGARATTVFPEIKGDKLDEAFVPCDIRSGGCYLRDLELGLMLHKMVVKGLHATVVLDCCHSGGGVRGNRRRSARAAEGCYRSLLPVDLPDSASEILDEKLRSVMLDEPSGFSLMTSCLPHEQAEEIQLNNGRWSGIFTHSLMMTLRYGLSSFPSPRAIYDCVCAKVRDEFDHQTPRFLGETNRFFYDLDVVTRLPALSVRRLLDGLEVDDEAELSGGYAHGVVEGSEYAIIPFGATEVPRDPMRLLVEKVMSVFSIASIRTSENENKGQVMAGCQAVLLSLPYGTSCLVGISMESIIDRNVFIREWEENCGDDNWLRLVKKDESKPLTFQVTLDKTGNFHILDGNGAPWPNITPPLPAVQHTDPQGTQTIISRLRHLARFLAVKKISNSNLTSRLRGKVSFQITRHGHDGLNSQALEHKGGEYLVKNREKIDLRVENLSGEPITFVILDLQPLYGITQVYPAKADFESLEAKSDWHVRGVKMVTPPVLIQSASSGSSSLDILKLFVTTKGESFHSLKLPNIMRSHGSRAGRPTRDSMAQLLRQMSGSRDAEVYGDIDDWQVVEIRVRTEA